MRVGSRYLLPFALALFICPASVHAQEQDVTDTPAAETVVAGLSQESIGINANFDGSAIMIYGAVKRIAPDP